MLSGSVIWLIASYIIQIAAQEASAADDKSIPMPRSQMWQLLGCLSPSPPTPHLLHRQHHIFRPSISACIDACSAEQALFAMATPFQDIERVKCDCSKDMPSGLKTQCSAGDAYVYELEPIDRKLDIHDFVFLIEHLPNAFNGTNGTTDAMADTKDERSLWWSGAKWIGGKVWSLLQWMATSPPKDDGDRFYTPSALDDGTTTTGIIAPISPPSIETSSFPTPSATRMIRRSRIPIPPDAEEQPRDLCQELLDVHLAIRDIHTRLHTTSEYHDEDLEELHDLLHDFETSLAIIESDLAKSTDTWEDDPSPSEASEAKATITALPAIEAHTLEFIDVAEADPEQGAVPTAKPRDAESGQPVWELGRFPPSTSAIATPDEQSVEAADGNGGWFRPFDYLLTQLKRGIDKSSPLEETISTFVKQIHLLEIYISDTTAELEFARSSNADRTMIGVLQTKLAAQEHQLQTVQENLEMAYEELEQSTKVRAGIAFMAENL